MQLCEDNVKLTIENICSACEIGNNCVQPCEAWYDCFEDNAVDPKRICKTSDCGEVE